MNSRRVLLVSALMAAVLLLPALGYAQTQYNVSFPHIAFGKAGATDYWDTHYIIWNTGTTQATVVLHHFNDSGQPLTVSIDSVNATSHTFTIPAGGTIDKAVDALSFPTVNGGWTAVDPTGSVKGQVVFRQHTTNAADHTARLPEATVPMNNSNPPLCIIPFPTQSSQVSIPFDNTGGYTAALAVVNTTNAAVAYTVTFVGLDGVQLCTTTLNMPAFGHAAYIVTSGGGAPNPTAAACAASANQKGTAVITGTGASAMGLRFNFNTSEFTTSLQ